MLRKIEKISFSDVEATNFLDGTIHTVSDELKGSSGII